MIADLSPHAVGIVCALVQHGSMELEPLGQSVGLWVSLHYAVDELVDARLATSCTVRGMLRVTLLERGAAWWRDTIVTEARALSPVAQRLVIAMHKLSRDQRRPGDTHRIDWREVAEHIDGLPEVFSLCHRPVMFGMVGTGTVHLSGDLYVMRSLTWYAVALTGSESPWVNDSSTDWILGESQA